MTIASVDRVPVEPEMAKKLQRAAAKSNEWREERDRLILEAYQLGGGLREIARLVGLTHPGVLNIIGKAEQLTVKSDEGLKPWDEPEET